MAATLKTISERVGISQAAVSMILNRSSKDISSQATRDKVFAIAKELNYKQKFGHKLLRGDKTHAAVILISIKRLLMEEPIQQLPLSSPEESLSSRNYLPIFKKIATYL